MSDWKNKTDDNVGDNADAGDKAKPKAKAKSKGGRAKTAAAQDAPLIYGEEPPKRGRKTNANRVILPYVSFPPNDIFVDNLDKIESNSGEVASLIGKLVPHSCVAVERTTAVRREDGSVAFVEVRLEEKNGGKTYRTVFLADVEGSDDPKQDGRGVLRTDFTALYEQGLFIPTNAPGLLEGQRHVADNPGLRLAIFWCEGAKAAAAVEGLLQTDLAQAMLAEKELHAVVSATLGGQSGARKTNYALRPRLGTNPRFIVEGKNSTALQLDIAQHFIVRDNDQAGREEASTIVERLNKEFGVELSAVRVIEPPEGVFEGWDDHDGLPAGFTEQDRLKQLLETEPLGDSWTQHRVCGTWPDGVDKMGVPQKTMHNAMFAIEEMGHHLYWDEFSRRAFIDNEGLKDRHATILRDKIRIVYGFDPGRPNVEQAVDTLAERNVFNPMLEHFNQLPVWDGTPRIDTWLSRYLSAPDTELNRTIGRITLVAAVRRVKRPGVKFDTVPVLEGGQGTGKSTAIRILAGDKFFGDSDIVHVPTKEQVERLDGVWIQELAELVGLSKADVNSVKNFVSRQVDRTRVAYGRKSEDFPRQCIFIGTTNESVYLRDTTGNRRFWPVSTGAIDLVGLAEARDQLWAEAIELERTGFSLLLPEHLWAVAEGEQQSRMTTDVLVDVLDQLTPEECTPEGHRNEYYRITYVRVFEFIQGRTKMDGWSKVPYQRLDTVMKQLGWETNKFVQCTVFENGVAKKKQMRCFQRMAENWDQAPKPDEPAPVPYDDDIPF